MAQSVRISFLALGALALVACTSGETSTNDAGGNAATGGSTAAGGSGGTGGSGPGGTGGARGTAGATGAGGGAAGSTGAAGTMGSGAGGRGGAGAGAGGRTGTGGAPGSGGGAAGNPGAAGSTGTAGSTGSQYWIGPTGADTNPGTQASPFLTLTAAHARATAGTTIWVLPGTYRYSATASLTKNGTAAQPINILAAAGARPVLDFSGQPRDTSSARGIQISGDYWHIQGLEIENAGDNCIWIGGSHNTMEQLVIHGCDDTGLQITASVATDPTRGAFNTILNVDSYENFDGATGGENADGFAAKLHIGPGNVFQGCRSWNNADDGWDLFAANDVVVITGCWAFLNGKTVGGESNPGGDGNGFKLGGAPTPGDPDSGGAVHVVTSSYAFENLACGFVQNNNPDVPQLNMCGSSRNGTAYCQTLSQSSPMNSFTMTGAQAKAAARNPDGSLPAIH